MEQNTTDDLEIILGLIGDGEERDYGRQQLEKKYAGKLGAFLCRTAPLVTPDERLSIVRGVIAAIVEAAGRNELDDVTDLAPVLLRLAKGMVRDRIGGADPIVANVNTLGSRLGVAWKNASAMGGLAKTKENLRNALFEVDDLSKAVLQILNHHHPNPISDFEIHQKIIRDTPLLPTVPEVALVRKSLRQLLRNQLENPTLRS